MRSVKELIGHLEGPFLTAMLSSVSVHSLTASSFTQSLLHLPPPLRPSFGFCSNVTWPKLQKQGCRPKYKAKTSANWCCDGRPPPTFKATPPKANPCDSLRPITAQAASCLLLPFAWVTTRPAVAEGVIHHTPVCADVQGFSTVPKRLPSITSRTDLPPPPPPLPEIRVTLFFPFRTAPDLLCRALPYIGVCLRTHSYKGAIHLEWGGGGGGGTGTSEENLQAESVKVPIFFFFVNVAAWWLASGWPSYKSL